VVPHEEEAEATAPVGGKKAPAKAPAKGKAQTPAEDAKPTHGRAWLNLTPLLQPGVKQVTQRAFLQQCSPAEAHHPQYKPPTAGEEADHVSAVDAIQKTDGTDSVEAPTDLFQEGQSYVYLTVTLGEPLYPSPKDDLIKADASALLDKYDTPPTFPSTRDAIREFEDAINFLVQQIGAEYEKANLDADQPTTSTPNLLKAQATFMSSQNIAQLADQRREKFLTEFTQSSKYQELRNRLKQAIFRLGMEKIKKQTSAKKLSADEKDKFKASLYIFLQRKMRECLAEAVTVRHRSRLHNDIVSQLEVIEGGRQDKICEGYQEDSATKFSRLALEFDTLTDLESAEKNFVNHLVDHPTDGKKWGEFAQFALRYGLQIKAEQCLFKQIECDGGQMDTDCRIFLGALMLQRQNYPAAKQYLDVVLDESWTHLNANLLAGLLYKLTDRPEMSRKHFAIAKVTRMRALSLLPPKSSIPKNFRTEAIEFKVEIVDYKRVKTVDEQLTGKDCDLLYFELIDFLLERTVFGVADMALDFIGDKTTARYLMAKAQIRVLQKEYKEATEALDRLLE
jgi:tetratricopeptide (TPR) repeat protein